MSLRRAIKAEGLGNFLKLGYAMATSQKVVPAAKPHNETLRAARVNDSGLIGRDVSRQFEIFAEIAKTVLGCETGMVNLLDGACQYTIGAAGKGYDPLLGVPQELTFCQYALLSPEPFIVPDTNRDARFAGSVLTKPPLNCGFYAGFPLNTPDGVVLGTLCGTHPTPLSPDEEQVRIMTKLATTAAAQIQLMIEQSALTASRIGGTLAKFRQFAPDGTLDELMGFLDFCARGTAPAETMDMLAADGIIAAEAGDWRLTRDGTDLRAALGLAPETYRGSEQTTAPQGQGVDDLLGKLE
ncbi:MAG: GAF domain-containing protein [Pseudomonadota bacterium]|nr:GAF domain-containing protein [Pseudomonadota bacterium]